jgi:uncharacterized protein
MPDPTKVYDAQLDIWPELKGGRNILAPVRVGMDRRTGKMLVGWPHVVQSMEVIFMTRYHERVLRRWVGSFVPHLLGKNAIERVITRFYWAIASAIDLWEPNFRIVKVEVTKKGTSGLEALTSSDDLRQGHLVTNNIGVYRPRGHLGDFTPEQRRTVGLVGIGDSLWKHNNDGG